MGEYQKTRDQIAKLKAERDRLLQEIQERQERLDEIRVEISDCEGYLLELDWIDNHNDPDWRANH